MSDNTYKILLFLKRKPNMSMEDFRDYYENVHARLGEKYSQGLTRYVRRYLEPMPNPETGEDGELPYDVITELWFGDEQVFNAMVKYLSTTVLPDEVVEDEKNLFNRSQIRMATVIECDSDLKSIQ